MEHVAVGKQWAIDIKKVGRERKSKVGREQKLFENELRGALLRAVLVPITVELMR
jgi:hypothetical protein